MDSGEYKGEGEEVKKTFNSIEWIPAVVFADDGNVYLLTFNSIEWIHDVIRGLEGRGYDVRFLSIPLNGFTYG